MRDLSVVFGIRPWLHTCRILLLSSTSAYYIYHILTKLKRVSQIFILTHPLLVTNIIAIINLRKDYLMMTFVATPLAILT